MLTSFELFVAAVASGIALVYIGVGWAIFRTFKSRFGVLTSGVLFTLSGSWSIEHKAAIVEAIGVGILTVAYTIYWIGHTSLAIQIRGLLLRPVAFGTVLTVGGMVLIGASMWRFDRVNDDESVEFLERMALWRPPLEQANLACLTDTGKTIPVYAPTEIRSNEVTLSDEQKMLLEFNWIKKVIPQSPASEISNCHGWVFTGGKYWILGTDVATILKDNGYRPTRFPRPGDLAVYQKPDGTIEHTAIVRSVGTVTMVEGKWGWMGVYLHPVDASCYGQKFTYYHANRRGHQFAVLNPRDAEHTPVSPFNGMQARRPVPLR